MHSYDQPLIHLSNTIKNLHYQSAESIYATQNERFCKHIQYTAAHSPFYQDLFKKHDLDPNNLSLGDISRIPFTSKNDIQENEHQFLCIPHQKVIEYVTTSGTLGSPVTFMLSEIDLQRLAENEYQALTCAGGTENDIYQIIVTLDKRFMAGMAYYLGVRKIGAGIVRTGVENLAFQLDTIMRIKPTVLIAVPSFLIKLINYATAEGVNLSHSTVQKVICIGEPIRRFDFALNTLGQRISNQWNVQLYSTYASTEMSTAFTECKEGQGGHQFSELIFTEIVDDAGQAVKPGQPGELVVTPFGVEAMPLIRFRTGDICRQYIEPCSCGRTSPRLGPVEGRRQQMIKYKGTSLYPPALFDVLNGVKEISQYLITLQSDDLDTDNVLVEYCSDAEKSMTKKKLKELFRSYIRVVPELRHISRETMTNKTLDTMSRKAITLLDLRNHKTHTI